MSNVRRWIVRKDAKYKIVAEQHPGCSPNFHLYSRASFFGLFSWWSYEGFGASVEGLVRHIAAMGETP